MSAWDPVQAPLASTDACPEAGGEVAVVARSTAGLGVPVPAAGKSSTLQCRSIQGCHIFYESLVWGLFMLTCLSHDWCSLNVNLCEL